MFGTSEEEVDKFLAFYELVDINNDRTLNRAEFIRMMIQEPTIIISSVSLSLLWLLLLVVVVIMYIIIIISSSSSSRVHTRDDPGPRSAGEGDARGGISCV